MWEYTDKVKDHFLHPRNAGELKDANIVAEVGNIACGDALKLMLKIDENEIIQEVKFQTFGCGSAIASSSILTEMIKGKTLSDALKLTNQSIVDELGGLPKAKLHCSVMAEEALQKAGDLFFGTEKEHEDTSPIICKCFKVTEHKIRSVIQEHGLKTIEEVTDYTKAGGGCGNCIADIENILNDELEKSSKANEKGEILNLDRIEMIKKVIKEDVQPFLQKDGGGIDVYDIESTQVKVRFRGACASCMSSNVTLKDFVEKVLREKIDENISVEAV